MTKSRGQVEEKLACYGGTNVSIEKHWSYSDGIQRLGCVPESPGVWLEDTLLSCMTYPHVIIIL